MKSWEIEHWSKFQTFLEASNTNMPFRVFPFSHPTHIISFEGFTRKSSLDLLRSEKCIINPKLLSHILSGSYCQLLFGRICEVNS